MSATAVGILVGLGLLVAGGIVALLWLGVRIKKAHLQRMGRLTGRAVKATLAIISAILITAWKIMKAWFQVLWAALRALGGGG